MEKTRVLHYELVRQLGRGGMGEVYEARDLELGRRVALKFVAPELSADPDSLRRFEREARSAAGLAHPHIARVHAFRRDGDRPFIDMEFMEGESLRDLMRRGPLPVPRALAIARDVASALAHAHRRDIVHRDLKPENLMFDGEGVIKLMDFGLARAAHASRLTMTGTTLGTAAYMSPESVRGTPGAPADVFALGCMLQEMLTGSLPFAGDSPLALLYTISNEPPTPLSAGRPDAGSDVEVLVARMLTKNPDERPSAAAVANELSRMLGGSGAGATEELEVERIPASELPTLAIPSRKTLAPTPKPPAAPRSSRFAVAAWAVLVVVLAAVVASPLSRGCGGGARRRERAIAEVNRGTEALQAGRADEAEGHFRDALRLDPRFARAMLNLALLHEQSGRTASAESLYNQALRHAGRDSGALAIAHYNLGSYELRSRAWSAAIDHLEASLAIDSARAGPFNNLGYALVMADRPQDALALLERATLRFPGESALFKNAGLAALRLGQLERARALLGTAVALDRERAIPRALLARVLEDQGDTRAARAVRRGLDSLFAARPGDAPERAAYAGDAQELAALGIRLAPAAPSELPGTAGGSSTPR
jgi:Tfp pilus assembly protein PilF